MKKWIVSGFLLCMLTLAAENLITNGDLTKGARSWTFASWTKTPGTREIKKEGDMYYLSLSNTRDNKFATMCVQQIKLKSDTTYMFKFRMRTKDVKRQLPNKVTHGAGISFTAGRYLFAGAAQMWHMIEGTTGWTQYRGTFKTGKLKPGQLVSLYPSLTLATGTADFTDFSLEEVKENAGAAAPVQKKNRVNLFPVEFQNGKYRIAKNFVATWDLTFTGKKPAKQTVTFELPAGFEVIGGAATRPAEDKKEPWIWKNEKPLVKKLANGLTCYTMVLPARVVKEWGAWNNSYRIFVKATGKAGTKGAGRWYADGNMPQPLNLETLPPLSFSGKVPEKFIICPTFVPNLVGAPEFMGDQHINLWKNLSKNRIICIDPWAWRHTDWSILGKKTAGFKKSMEIGSHISMPRLGFARWKMRDPKARKVKFPLCVPRSAREPEETLCPSYVISDPEGFIWDNYFPTLLRERAGKSPIDIIDFDFEPHPNRACFCAVCLKDFYAFSKLKGPMTREQILSRHSGTWFKFRVEQHRKIIKLYHDTCRKYFPGKKVSLVTDVLHHTGSVIADWCAVDCRLSDNIGLDYMRNMPYFEGTSYYDNTVFNRKHIKTPWFPFIDPTEPSRRFYIRYTPDGVKLNIVATAMLGSVGIGFWPNDFFDGAYLHGIVRASRIIGAAENYYFKGTRCDNAVKFTAKNTVKRELSDDGEKFILQTPDFTPHLRHTVHKMGDKLLLTVLNYHPEEDVILEIEPENAKLIPAALAGCSLPERSANGKYLVKIKATDAGIWEFSVHNKVIAAGKISNELQKFLKSSSGKKVDNGLNYGLLRPEKRAMLKLDGGKRSIYINAENQALVMGWRSASSALNDVLNLRGNRGNLGELVVPFLKGRKKFTAKKKGGSIEFNYVVPAPEDANPDAEKYTGVEIIKRISLANGGNTVNCEWEIINKNHNGNAIEFFARIRNIPMMGSLIPEDKLPGAAVEVSSGKLVSPVGSPVSTIWHKKGAKLEFSNAKLENWNGEKVRFAVKSFGEEEALEFSFDKGCYGVHFWRENAGILTVEPLYRFNIPNGKKVVIRQSVTYTGIGKIKKKSNNTLTDHFTGIVFEDKNGNGKQDSGEKGLAGIRVSDGISVIKTANDGRFKLKKNAAARFVFASRPAGYKCSTPFFKKVDCDSFDFGFSPTAKRPLAFYHVTDTEARGPEAWLAEITRQGKKDKGDFLIHTGDIVGIPVHAQRMPECGMDSFAVPGNHDMERTGTNHTREVYEEHFGPVYYSFDAGSFRFYSLVYQRNLKDPANQLAWLKNELALLPAGKKIVIFRHEPPQYGDNLMTLLFSKYSKRIVGFICGHTHSLLCRKFDGIPVWENSPAPSGGLDHSPRAWRIFREVEGKLISKVVYSAPRKIKDPVVKVDPAAPAVETAAPFAMSGMTPARNAYIKGNISSLRLKWVADTKGIIHHALPLIVNGKVFAVTSDDDMAENSAVFAFNVSNGKLLWKKVIGAAVKGGLAADKINIYACGADGLVTALRQSDGRILWKTRIADVDKTNGMYGAAIVSNGKLYFYNEAPVIIDVRNGKILHQGKTTCETGGVWHAGVTVAGKIGVSGVSWRYGLKGFDLVSGKILWTRAQGRDFTYLDAAPVYCDGKIYFKARRKLFILDPADGKVIKEAVKPAGMETPSIPVVTEKAVIFGSCDGFYAYDKQTLKKIWGVKPGYAIVPSTAYSRGATEVAASCVVVGNTVICGAHDGKLYLLDVRSGKVLQKIQLDSQIMAQCAVSGNTVVAVSMNGKIYTFTAK